MATQDTQTQADGQGMAAPDPMQLEGVPPYDEEKERIVRFLMGFEDYDGKRTYQLAMLAVLNRKSTQVDLRLDDLVAFEQGDTDLATRMENNAQRYIELSAEAVVHVLKDQDLIRPTEDIADREDVWDVLEAEREAAMERDNRPLPEIPESLTRRFQVKIIPRDESKATSLRDVRSKDMGRLVKVKGMVTRTSDVKPLLTVVTYTCEQCQTEVFQEVGRVTAFTPIPFCPAKDQEGHVCKGRLIMQTRGSKFVKYQELRLQELPEQVPMGHIPRCMVVHCSGETTRKCAPGDMVTIDGIFLPMKYTGFKALKAGLIADTYLEAQHILKHKKAYDEETTTDEIAERMQEAASEPDVYEKLARSIAPEIYGHLDVKKALLLQLVGAPTRKLSDGMKIRGDINVILVGDPGVAKSQLIKYISRVAPRGVYTTGKGTSGVGLTAAVLRDPVTGDMTLEGGALVMADMGVCCIDEFDKMDEGDRTAIHEVMEQQTVSIAKAGITTTLNARCSVLAAANPLYGRYNKSRSMSDNINLPNSLLSRFDLVFLILDKANAERDMALARHVSYVHRHLKNPEGEDAVHDLPFLKAYIAEARQVTPKVPRDLASFIADQYVALRMEKDEQAKAKGMQGWKSARGSNDQTAMTARQLLSILRLAQGLARLRFDEEVSMADLEEAIRLTRMSKSSLEEDDDEYGNNDGGAMDAMSKVYALVKDYMMQHNLRSLEYRRAEAMVVQKGFKTDDLREMLDFYVTAGIFDLSSDRTEIFLTNTQDGEDGGDGDMDVDDDGGM